MKLLTMGITGLAALVGITLMSSVIAAVPADGAGRPAFEGGRGQGHGGGMRGRFGGRRGPDAERQLGRMDANDDGQVSEDEFVDARLAFIDEMFERRDRDNDGLLSLDENTRPERPDRPNRADRSDRPDLDREEVIACVQETIPDFAPNADMDIEDRFEDTDTDGNGSLSLAEVSAVIEERAHEQFALIDADTDGFITDEELDAHHETQLDTRRAVRECTRELIQA
ncbi:MAG: hypothetical protein V4628_15280 [Pseudomonadota bacterium]